MTQSGFVILILILIILTALIFGSLPAVTVSVISLSIMILLQSTRSEDMLDTQEVDDSESIDIKAQPDQKWDNSANVAKLFARVEQAQAGNGDDRLVAKSIDVASRSKEAILNRTRFTSNNFRKYYEEELMSEENRHWWENDDSLDLEMDKKFAQ